MNFKILEKLVFFMFSLELLLSLPSKRQKGKREKTEREKRRKKKNVEFADLVKRFPMDVSFQRCFVCQIWFRTRLRCVLPDSALFLVSARLTTLESPSSLSRKRPLMTEASAAAEPVSTAERSSESQISPCFPTHVPADGTLQ